MIDWTINITQLVSLGIALATGVAAWVTLRGRVGELEKDFAEHRTDTATQSAAVSASLKIMQERTEEVRAKGAKELADFKLEVAKDYAGHTALREMEQRLVKAIDDLGRRIDKPVHS